MMKPSIAKVRLWKESAEARDPRLALAKESTQPRPGMPVVINPREPQPQWQKTAGDQIHQATGTFGEQLYLKKDGSLIGFGEGDVVRLIPPDLPPLKQVMARGGLAAGVTAKGEVRMWGHRGVTSLMQERMPKLPEIVDLQITGNEMLCRSAAT